MTTKLCYAKITIHRPCYALLHYVDNIETYLMSGSCMSIKEVQHIHNNCHRHTILKGRRRGEAGMNVTYRKKDFKQHCTSSTQEK